MEQTSTRVSSASVSSKESPITPMQIGIGVALAALVGVALTFAQIKYEFLTTCWALASAHPLAAAGIAVGFIAVVGITTYFVIQNKNKPSENSESSPPISTTTTTTSSDIPPPSTVSRQSANNSVSTASNDTSAASSDIQQDPSSPSTAASTVITTSSAASASSNANTTSSSSSSSSSLAFSLPDDEDDAPKKKLSAQQKRAKALQDKKGTADTGSGSIVSASSSSSVSNPNGVKAALQMLASVDKDLVDPNSKMTAKDFLAKNANPSKLEIGILIQRAAVEGDVKSMQTLLAHENSHDPSLGMQYGFAIADAAEMGNVMLYGLLAKKVAAIQATNPKFLISDYLLINALQKATLSTLPDTTKMGRIYIAKQLIYTILETAQKKPIPADIRDEALSYAVKIEEIEIGLIKQLLECPLDQSLAKSGKSGPEDSSFYQSPLSAALENAVKANRKDLFDLLLPHKKQLTNSERDSLYEAAQGTGNNELIQSIQALSNAPITPAAYTRAIAEAVKNGQITAAIVLINQGNEIDVNGGILDAAFDNLLVLVMGYKDEMQGDYKKGTEKLVKIPGNPQIFDLLLTKPKNKDAIRARAAIIAFSCKDFARAKALIANNALPSEEARATILSFTWQMLAYQQITNIDSVKLFEECLALSNALLPVSLPKNQPFGVIGLMFAALPENAKKDSPYYIRCLELSETLLTTQQGATPAYNQAISSWIAAAKNMEPSALNDACSNENAIKSLLLQ